VSKFYTYVNHNNGEDIDTNFLTASLSGPVGIFLIWTQLKNLAKRILLQLITRYSCPCTRPWRPIGL
jgi:hypothetical protein